ncbi:MAG: hypothetical protein CM1200mP39_11820 [Dehalococcoidia bacterium]|nr:MAG: hypothetical protein CM1200mP39_11820 [Dehalococcoidia bacterium]
MGLMTLQRKSSQEKVSRQTPITRGSVTPMMTRAWRMHGKFAGRYPWRSIVNPYPKRFQRIGGSTYTYTDVMPDHERFNPEWKVEYDVEGAKKLLAEAGVPRVF